MRPPSRPHDRARRRSTPSASRTCARPTRCSPASSTATRSSSRRDTDRDGDHYAALIRAIVGQQLSTTVARVMWGRMLERFGGRPPTPQEVLDDDPEELRAAIGLSRAKVSFLRSLAEHIAVRRAGPRPRVDAAGRRADPRADRRQGHRRLVGAHVPHVPAPAAGRPGLGRPRRAARARSSRTASRSCPTGPSSSCWPSPGGRTGPRRAGCCGGRWTTSRADAGCRRT